jgi:hypothetical protein
LIKEYKTFLTYMKTTLMHWKIDWGA